MIETSRTLRLYNASRSPLPALPAMPCSVFVEPGATSTLKLTNLALWQAIKMTTAGVVQSLPLSIRDPFLFPAIATAARTGFGPGKGPLVSRRHGVPRRSPRAEMRKMAGSSRPGFLSEPQPPTASRRCGMVVESLSCQQKRRIFASGAQHNASGTRLSLTLTLADIAQKDAREVGPPQIRQKRPPVLILVARSVNPDLETRDRTQTRIFLCDAS
jgi:hypothetical protein